MLQTLKPAQIKPPWFRKLSGSDLRKSSMEISLPRVNVHNLCFKGHLLLHANRPPHTGKSADLKPGAINHGRIWCYVQSVKFVHLRLKGAKEAFGVSFVRFGTEEKRSEELGATLLSVAKNSLQEQNVLKLRECEADLLQQFAGSLQGRARKNSY